MNAKEHQASQLFLQHYSFVLGLAFQRSPFPGLAHDIFQETFTQFVTNADRYDLEKDIRPLLRGIVRNVALNHWKARAKLLPTSLQRIAEHVQAEWEDETADFAEELAALKICLNRLPPKSRSLLEKRYFEEQATREIASRLETTESSLRKTLCRIREKLKSCIDRVLAKGESHV